LTAEAGASKIECSNTPCTQVRTVTWEPDGDSEEYFFCSGDCLKAFVAEWMFPFVDSGIGDVVQEYVSEHVKMDWV